MFDRFLIFAKAKRALSQDRFETVLRLLDDPSVRLERRAEQLRQRALAGLLQRAKSRAAASDLVSALRDIDTVIQAAPEFPGASDLHRELLAQQSAHSDRMQSARGAADRARHCAERGDLVGARAALEECGASGVSLAEMESVARFVASKSDALQTDLESLRAAIAAADLPRVRDLAGRLRAQPELLREQGTAKEFSKLDAKAARLLGNELGAELQRLPDSDAVSHLVAELASDPALRSDPVVAKHLVAAGKKIEVSIRKCLAAEDFAAATAEWGAQPEVLRAQPALQSLSLGLAALKQSLDASDGGNLEAALQGMREAAQVLACKRCTAAAKRLESCQAQAAQAVAESRELAATGRLVAAREALVAVTSDWPMHEPIRRQMDILDQQALDRDERLAQARESAKDGRLKQASAMLLGLSGDGEEGREARALLQDVQSRMDLAAEGLAQVRRALHGPKSTREGLRQCVARLDELAKVQCDFDELSEVRDALEAEIEGLDLLAATAAAVAAEDAEAAGKAICAFDALRGRMLRADRLDARFLELAEEMLTHADTGVHHARLQDAAAWVGVVSPLAREQGLLASRIDTVQSTLSNKQSEAEALLDELDGVDAGQDPEAAAELLDAVRAVWVDSPRLRQIEYRVRAQRQHNDAADEAERLTGAGDVPGAHRALESMPPTPDFLRTRIFDIKQGLARAQGLDEGFLLRVDEGGEYLVLREDSFTIGNVRDAKADVRILANVAGVHARFKRSLSFHGGMEDRIVAERGEVFINGEKVDSAALRSGDVVRLGSALEFRYQVPGKRSLSAVLHLKSGFQVAGTDKILLMKDRGRDGRILVGRASDAHIRVPHDESEVELFGAKDGQIHVRFSGKGDMAGKPFTGSQPVTAGSLVRCGETAFVLQPRPNV